MLDRRKDPTPTEPAKQEVHAIVQPSAKPGRSFLVVNPERRFRVVRGLDRGFMPDTLQPRDADTLFGPGRASRRPGPRLPAVAGSPSSSLDQCGPGCTRVSGAPSTAADWAPSSFWISAGESVGRSTLTVSLLSLAVSGNGGL
jgi:hypothetical protein